MNRQGGCTPPSFMHSSQAVSMEQAALSVPTGNPCPGHSEQGRSPFVVGEPTLRRMAPPPSDSGTAMEEVWSGSCSSLRLMRKRKRTEFNADFDSTQVA